MADGRTSLGSVRVQSLGRAPRKMRHPNHPFNLEVRPWQLQPFMIAPVLPGETLKNLLLQSRAVSFPIKNSEIGWWSEYYFFYVKHRDLDARDTLVNLMLDPSTSVAGIQEAGDVKYYHSSVGANRINWAKLCLKRVVEDYFRNDGEAWNIIAVDNLPVASINQTNVLDSVINDAERMAVDVDVDGPDVNTTIQASEVDIAMRTWQFLRTNGMTEMTYEDYLATFGVRRTTVEIHKPELVRFVREWTYPSSTVEPTTGVPSAAVSWKTAERADKDRYFKEPGFLIGVCCFRPKVYLKNQDGSFTGSMDTTFSWLPSVMSDDPLTSYKKQTNGRSPLPGATDSWWWDVKDLFVYGEQFVNYNVGAATTKNTVSLPTAANAKRYVGSTDMDALFSAAAPANVIRVDGVVSLSIAGSQIDTSPTR